jgi:hypothetical protein
VAERSRKDLFAGLVRLEIHDAEWFATNPKIHPSISR